MPDKPLEAVRSVLSRTPNAEERLAKVVRSTFDQIYDGVHTGRYRWDQLAKTEKTHFGSLFEINLQREFEFAEGARLDFSIGGVDVDCKYSQSASGWMIPVEAQNEICLVVTANDHRSSWSAGVVRCSPKLLGAPNRDLKRSLTEAGRNAIAWIWRQSPFPPNVLLQVNQAEVRAILVDLAGPRNGQKRINELFRRVTGKRITRGVVATVAQQVDYMKRVRGNGGARSALRSEGFVILGDYSSHRRIAVELGLPEPEAGEFVSALLTSGSGLEGSLIDGQHWRAVREGEKPTVPAPILPSA